MDIKELEEDEGRGIQTARSPKCGHKASRRMGARMGIVGSRKQPGGQHLGGAQSTDVLIVVHMMKGGKVNWA